MYADSYGAAVFRGEHILLIRSRRGHWTFPKGRQEAGEEPLDTAKREVFEETGITAQIDKSISYTVPSIHGDGRSVTFYPAKYIRGEVCPQKSEVLAAGWYTYEEARALMSTGPDCSVLETMLQFRGVEHLYSDPRI